jgi:peptide subunit release factor 1 (eRF1)
MARLELHVPPKRPLQDVIQQLSLERGSASNMKPGRNKDEVTLLLTRVLGYLKGRKDIPPNGFILIANNEGFDIQLPDKPVDRNSYRMDP